MQNIIETILVGASSAIGIIGGIRLSRRLVKITDLPKFELFPVPSKGYMAIYYTGEVKSWRKTAPTEAGTEPRHLWIKCAVCDVTRVTHPWYKRVRYVRAENVDSHFTPMAIKYNGSRVWGMCSDECLNMFYLGNEK